MKRRLFLVMAVLLTPAVALASGGEGGTHLGIPDGILKAINFVLFFGLIIYLAARPVAKALRDRREAIGDDQAEAAHKRDEAARTEEEIRRRIESLEAEVETFRQKAEEDGRRDRAEIIARAEEEAERILEHARAEVSSQAEAVRRDLASYAGRLATELATRRIEGDLDDEARRRFLDRSIEAIRSIEV